MHKQIWLQHLDLQRIVSVVEHQAKHFEAQEISGASYFDVETQRIELIIYESTGSTQSDLALLTKKHGHHYFLFHSVKDIVRSNHHRVLTVS